MKHPAPSGPDSPDLPRSVESSFTRYYGDLRALAHRQLRGERQGHILQTTALIHEAFLRMRTHRGRLRDKVHFLALATTAMRRVLVAHARASLAGKRGHRPVQVTLGEKVDGRDARLIDALALDEAIESLTRLSPRGARVAELRLYVGLSVDETASAVGVSPRTVKEDWRLARAWLTRRLRKGPTEIP